VPKVGDFFIMTEYQENTECVYILESDVGYYKIGRTKKLDDRILKFEVNLPFNVELLHRIYVDNSAHYEGVLHKLFANRRVGGEWFVLNFHSLKILTECETQADLDMFIDWCRFDYNLLHRMHDVYSREWLCLYGDLIIGLKKN
jgi:hypothetical protein